MKEVTINDKFASVAEALYLAEKQAREMVTMRAKMEEQVERVQADELEKRLANEAQQALEKRTQALTHDDEDDDDDLDDIDGEYIGGKGHMGGDGGIRDARRPEEGGGRYVTSVLWIDLYVSIFLSTYLYIFLSTYIYVSICLSVYICIYLSVYLCIYSRYQFKSVL